MTILDELAALARARRYGHGERELVERALCYLSKIPVEWCLGCRRGWHKHTMQPLPGAEPEEIIPADVEAAEVTPMDVTPPVIEPATVPLDPSAEQLEKLRQAWYDAHVGPKPTGIVRDPDDCPVCGPQGYGACRCNIASNE